MAMQGGIASSHFLKNLKELQSEKSNRYKLSFVPLFADSRESVKGFWGYSIARLNSSIFIILRTRPTEQFFAAIISIFGQQVLFQIKLED